VECASGAAFVQNVRVEKLDSSSLSLRGSTIPPDRQIDRRLWNATPVGRRPGRVRKTTRPRTRVFGIPGHVQVTSDEIARDENGSSRGAGEHPRIVRGLLSSSWPSPGLPMRSAVSHPDAASKGGFMKTRKILIRGHRGGPVSAAASDGCLSTQASGSPLRATSAASSPALTGPIAASG